VIVDQWLMPLSHARHHEAPRVDPEFQSLIAPLTPEERNQLEANIAAHGCRDAFVVWNGILLDGHNRFEICTRLKIRYKSSDIELPSRAAARLWIEENQIGRRNLSPDQKAAIAYRILQRRVALSNKDRARKGGLSGGSGRARLSLVVTSSTKQAAPRQREIVGVQLGVPSRKLRMVSTLARQCPEVVERIVSGELNLTEAHKWVSKKVIDARLKSAMRSHPDDGFGILTGDISKLSRRLEDNSADLFLTDPPWQEARHFETLAQIAKAKLKSGGLCAVHCGTYALPQIIEAMGRHLEFYWLCAAKINSASPRIWPKKIFQRFRPLLIFAKPPVKKVVHRWFADLVECGRDDKTHHVWGKSTDEVRHLLEIFTQPGQLVVDPFVGGGATPVACEALNRRFIGTEIDPGVAAAARARVVEFRKSQSKDH
jgi:DNA modification methylase